MLTQVTGVSGTFNTATTISTNFLYVIEIQDTDLDLANGFNSVQLAIATGGGSVMQQYAICSPRFGGNFAAFVRPSFNRFRLPEIQHERNRSVGQSQGSYLNNVLALRDTVMSPPTGSNPWCQFPLQSIDDAGTGHQIKDDFISVSDTTTTSTWQIVKGTGGVGHAVQLESLRLDQHSDRGQLERLPVFFHARADLSSSRRLPVISPAGKPTSTSLRPTPITLLGSLASPRPRRPASCRTAAFRPALTAGR